MEEIGIFKIKKFFLFCTCKILRHSYIHLDPWSAGFSSHDVANVLWPSCMSFLTCNLLSLTFKFLVADHVRSRYSRVREHPLMYNSQLWLGSVSPVIEVLVLLCSYNVWTSSARIDLWTFHYPAFCYPDNFATLDIRYSHFATVLEVISLPWPFRLFWLL